MGYVEERIKFMAVTAWQEDRMKHPLTCGTDGCDEGLYPKMLKSESSDSSTTHRTVLRCYSCDYEQDFVPRSVIDTFLTRI